MSYSELWQQLEDIITEERKEAKEEYGIYWVLNEERIWEEWFSKYCSENNLDLEVDDSEVYLDERSESELGDISLHLEDFCYSKLTRSYIREEVERTIKENAEEARTRAGEMGFHNYANGTYW